MMQELGLQIKRNANGIINVVWQRMPVERLFAGKTAREVIVLVPQLFSLCAEAQSVAARLVLAQAAAQTWVPDAAWRNRLRLESIRETLRWILLDLALAFDGKTADSQWLQRWRNALALPELKSLAQDFVFAESVETWLARDAEALKQWMKAGISAPARWAASLDLRTPALPCLPQQEALALARHAAFWQEETMPVWQGLPCEVGALCSEYESLADLGDLENLPRARLLARLFQLAHSLSGARREAVVASLEDERAAVACVATTRGPLLHYAALDARGRVRRYRVVPPTLWHCHPRGLVWQTLQALGEQGFVAEKTWRQQVALIDPCVAVEWLLEGGAPHA